MRAGCGSRCTQRSALRVPELSSAGILIDSDNALGSAMGDVDDAFAISAMLRSSLPVLGLSSVAGNTSEKKAFANNSALARTLAFTGPVLHGHEVPHFLESHPATTVLALGPLTNVAAAIRQGAKIAQVLMVGGNRSTRGRWPPWWPHEFNLTRDRQAALEIFRADGKLTIFPLDVTRKLAITRTDLADLEGDVASFLSSGARRWFTRLLLVKGAARFPVYDLVAALYLLYPDRFRMESTTARMDANTFLRFGEGERPVQVCASFDPRELWSLFKQTISS